MARTSLETGTDQLKCELENGVATITLNRPDKRNALSNELTPQETLTLRLFDLAKPTIAALPGAAVWRSASSTKSFSTTN